MMLRSPLSSALVLALALLLPAFSFAQPANDDCAGAIELFPASACNAVIGDVTGATLSIAATSCSGINGTADDDVWYRFTATATSHRIEVQGSAQFDAVIDLRSGGCNGTQVRCTDLAPVGVAEWLTPTGLTIGTEYLIRVYSRDATAPATTTFTICVREPLVPVNNDCANAISLTPNPTCAPTMGSVANATQSLPAIDCNGVGNANDDVWYSFVATGTSHTIEMTVPSGFFPVIDLRSGACNGTNIACNDDVTLTANALTVGETYYVRLYHVFGGIPSNTSFTICVIGATPPQCTADAGTITADATPVCLDNGFATISATPDGNTVVPVGYETIYLLSQGAGLTIEDFGASANFTVSGADDYAIHTLVYDPNTFDPNTEIQSGSTTGGALLALFIQGGGSLCGSLDATGAPITVEDCSCDAVAGTITPGDTPVCLDNGSATIDATPDGNSFVPVGFQTIYLLAQGAGQVIIAYDAIPSFIVTAAADYTIHTLVYNPGPFDPPTDIVLDATTIGDVDALLLQGGGTVCASLDLVGAALIVQVCVVCDADAGTITADATPVCLDNGSADISATPDFNSIIPPGYFTAYVLTQGAGLTIVNASATPDFTVGTADDYTIHTLVYDPNTLDLGSIEIGVTTGFGVDSLLIQGGGSICGSLDLTGAAITVLDCTCDADAGTLTANSAQVCQQDPGPTAIGAAFNTAANVPTGFVVLHLLTQGAPYTILDTASAPGFFVGGLGDHIIHTLVYDPTTLDLSGLLLGLSSAVDINAQLFQGGGSICGSLDLNGALITVVDCPDCPADAGTISSVADPVCLDNGSATISATSDGNGITPLGLDTLFVLTVGIDLTVVDTASAPSFTVTSADEYTIHTMLYDPTTFDLAGIALGTTTGGELYDLFIPNGGVLCGDLDAIGAPITVEECLPCDAFAGALIADASPVCLIAGSVTISATPDGGAVVPPGYEIIYVLSQGANLDLQAFDASPSFAVNVADSYTIHTLVYDPSTLDLGSLTVTTGFELNALLVQGGGSICAALDVTGALIVVVDCPPCDANAGTLTADETPVCLFGGTAQIGATPNGDAIVPTGYETVYVLTLGPDLVIVGVSTGPVFTVAAQGSYTIHTLVYDPLTIDPGAIELGVTTGFNINGLLIQGNGIICGSLDLAGATILVNDCAPGNNDCVNAFPLAVNLVANCPDQATAGTNTYATMDGGDASCDDPGANLLDVWYTFNSGANTTVTINFNPGTMEDWAISILDGCAGTELLCFVQPIDPIDFVTDPGTDYVVRIHSNLANGNGGDFTICITGDVPTTICDGGSVQTVDGFFSVDVCQDAVPDVIDFATTSAAAENYTFLLTDDNNIIVAQLVGGSLDFNSAALGIYYVWGISHNGDLVGADPGSLATAVTSTGTCIDFSDNYVQVNVEICDGLADVTTTSWSLFPNPGNGNFTLTYSGPGGFTTLEVIDMEGRMAHSQGMAMTDGQRFAVELNGKLAMGVYSIRLSNEVGSHTTRLVVR